MLLILVTGTPGAGKTHLSKKLAERFGLIYLDLKDLAIKGGFAPEYDKKRDCHIIDVDGFSLRLQEILDNLAQQNAKGVVLDSLFAHSLNISPISACVVVRCPLPILKMRLEKRGYYPKKVRENLDAEIFDTCLIEAEEAGLSPISVDGSQPISHILEHLQDKITGLAG